MTEKIDVRKTKKAKLKVSSGYLTSPLCNSPRWGWKVQVLWPRKEGGFYVLGEATSYKSEKAATDKAVELANEYLNN